MKLRLEENMLRLRLSDEEVQQFAQTGRVEYTLRLGPEPAQALTYTLEKLPDTDPAPELQLRYQPGQVLVAMPAAQVREWTDAKKIGFAAEIFVGESPKLRIVVEKDLGYQH